MPVNFYWAQLALTAAAYLVAGKLALLLAIPPGYATAVWPAAGLALAFTLFYGYRVWPGILAGSFLVNFWTSLQTGGTAALWELASVSLGIGGGAALQAVAAAWMVRRWVGFPSQLMRDWEVIRFLLLGGPVACVVSSTFGVSALLMSQTIHFSELAFHWWTWWVGDTIGVLIFAPLALMLAPALGQSRRRKLAVAVPLGFAFLLVLVVFVYASSREQRQIQNDFTLRTHALQERIERDLDAYIELLHSIRSLFASTPNADREAFRLFVERMLSRHRGLQALEWVPRVAETDREKFEAAARQDGFASFRFKVRDASRQMLDAPPKPEYYPVYFVEPYAGNEAALGFDLSSNPERWRALEMARDLDTAVSSAAIELVQARTEGLGILVMLPIYGGPEKPASIEERRRQLLGYALGVFHFEQWIHTTLRDVSLEDFEISLRDVTDPSAPALLYPSKEPSRTGPSSGIERTVSIPFAERTWALTFSPTPHFASTRRQMQAWSILAGGLLFTGLLGAVMLILTGRAAQIQELVVERTAELEQANSNLYLQVKERERAESEVLRLNEELERKVAARTAEIEAVNEALQNRIEQQQEVERALRSSEERFELAVGASNDGIWDWDLAGNGEFFSDRWCELLGYRPDELPRVYDTWLSRLHPEERDAVLEHVRRHLEDRDPYDIEYRLRTKSGEYRWFRVRGQAVWNEAGQPFRMAGSISDVTERRQIEQRQTAQYEITRLLAESEHLDRQLVTRILQLMVESLEWDLGELWVVEEGKKVMSCLAQWHVADLDCGEFIKASQEITFAKGEGLPGHIWSEAKDSRILDVTRDANFLRAPYAARAGLLEAFGFPLRNGPEVVGVMALFSRVSRGKEDPTVRLAPSLGSQIGQFIIRKRAEAEIRTLNAELEKRVAERTLQLEQANRRLQRDIAERKKVEEILRQSEERFETVFRASPIPISISTLAEGRFVEVNEAFLKLFGFERELVIGKSSVDLGLWASPEDRPRLAKLLQESGTVHNLESSFRTRSGEIRQSLSSAELITLQGKPCVVSILQDVTDRKRQEEELRQAKEAAEAASRAKSEFLASMSHEIRTPMNGVLGTLELLEDSALDDSQREMLGLARSSAEALLIIINDILDFSKIEAGKLAIEQVPFDLRLAIEESVDLFAIKSREKRIKLLMHYPAGAPHLLVGDPARLRQILMNLIGNAIKFTELGHIYVKVDLLEQSSRDVRLKISVEDTGIGISRDQQERIFERFTQADSSTTRRYGGTGLGLSICRRLLDLMNGEIGVESREGEGSIFWFTLRFEKQAAAEEISRWQAAIRHVRLMVVDDYKASREVLLEQTSKWGLRSEGFDSIGQAIEAARGALKAGDPFRIAIVDQDVLGGSAFTFGSALQSDAALRDIVLLMLASEADLAGQRSAESAGFNRVLIKPIRQSELLETLTELWTRKHRGQSSAPQPPLAAAGGPPKDVPPESAEARKRANVLVVDDNSVNQRVAFLMLSKLGCQVQTALNGREALEMVEAGNFDLVFMDCEMPVMDGFEATQRIRQLPGAKRQIAIVAMTAKAMKGDRERCLAAGMNDYLSKPMSQQKLEEALKRYASGGQRAARLDPAEAFPAPDLTSAGGAPGPAAPVLDVSSIRSLEKLAGGAQTTEFQQIIAIFLEDAPRRLAAMADAARQGAMEELRVAAHTLKGSSGLMGAHGLTELCRQIELGVAAGQVEALQPWIDRAEQEFKRVKDALARVMEPVAGQDQPGAGELPGISSG